MMNLLGFPLAVISFVHETPAICSFSLSTAATISANSAWTL